MVVVVWVDSDPNIYYSTKPFQNEGWEIKCFNETEDCLNAFRKNENNFIAETKCIITSMMERGGRKERGLKNALQMIDELKIIFKGKTSYAPFIGVITVSADEQQCKDHGVELVVYGDRYAIQEEVIKRLKIGGNAHYKIRWRDGNLLPCNDLHEKAKRFLESLGVSSSDMDPFNDRCFCENCEPRRIWYRGEPKEKYALPTGWYRYGIQLRDEYLNNQIQVENWYVAYHGTTELCAKSIISHRKIMFPGDQLKDGTLLPVRNNQCYADNFNDKPIIYVSPTILYSMHDVYAKPIPFEGKTVKVVIQSRVKPNSYKKFPETLWFGQTTIDSEFSNTEVEWVTDDKTAVVPYGLLIGFFD